MMWLDPRHLQVRVQLVIPGTTMQTFGFLFGDTKAEEGTPPVGHIYVKACTVAICRPAHGATHCKRVLSRPTLGWREFEKEIDRLQMELEAIRREAELRFADSTAARYRTSRPKPFRIRQRTN